jgi:hypothetical protein
MAGAVMADFALFAMLVCFALAAYFGAAILLGMCGQDRAAGVMLAPLNWLDRKRIWE